LRSGPEYNYSASLRIAGGNSAMNTGSFTQERNVKLIAWPFVINVVVLSFARRQNYSIILSFSILE
jgi:hypothetical protein